jgi:hypothetical protein
MVPHGKQLRKTLKFESALTAAGQMQFADFSPLFLASVKAVRPLAECSKPGEPPAEDALQIPRMISQMALTDWLSAAQPRVKYALVPG